MRARAIAKQIDDLELAIIDKRRPQANVTEVMNVIGDIKGKTCIMVDDIVDTTGTLCTAAEALKQEGAAAVVATSLMRCFQGQPLSELQLPKLIGWWSRIRFHFLMQRMRAKRSIS